MFKILIIGVLIMANLQANRLLHEDSPYLQQHAHNFVDWFPWGDEAFEKAKKENKLIFLSIGYSTCHWCHVMERESFENDHVAKILNSNYISIKVDREEYPHIDRYYQDIFVLMNSRSGGWPLSIVMTPDRKVFFSATYMPRDIKYGQNSFINILNFLDDAFKNRYDEVIKSANSIEVAIKANESKKSSLTPMKLDTKIAKYFVSLVDANYDHEEYGIGIAPKFPHATTFDVLIDIYKITKNKEALMLATKALSAMGKGGIYDQIEGGFYRYSTDEKWMIPHFEKMLYTNAELLESYANAYSVTNDAFYKEIVERSVKNIYDRFEKDNLLFSASDADSDGVEGKYFVFKYDESLAYLFKNGFSKDEAIEILNYFGISKEGNFEHIFTNPYLVGVKKPKKIEQGIKVLFEYRQRNNYPFIDHKIQTSWNALFIHGLFQVDKYMDMPYGRKALVLLDAVVDKLYIKDMLFHQVVIGKRAKVKGYLEDYSYLIAALIDAYQFCLDEKYLSLAKTLSDTAVMKFYKNDTWYMSDDEFVAKAELYDASYRSALAVMVENLFKIALLSDNYKLYSFAKRTLELNANSLNTMASNYPYAIKVALMEHFGGVVIKSTKENLLKHKKEIFGIDYPYILLKSSSDKSYLACKIDSCFISDKNISAVIEKINKLF